MSERLSMSKKSQELLKKASNFEKIAFKKSASFVEAMNGYDTTENLLIDFIEDLKISAYKSYNNGKGFPESALKLLLQQYELIAQALDTVMPQIKEIDETLLGTSPDDE